MENIAAWGRRRDELLTQLALRARHCPGLYPFQEAKDFLRVAQDHAGKVPEDLCRILEVMWQRPEEAVQLNAQSLIRRGQGLKPKAAVTEVKVKGIQGLKG